MWEAYVVVMYYIYKVRWVLLIVMEGNDTYGQLHETVSNHIISNQFYENKRQLEGDGIMKLVCPSPTLQRFISKQYWCAVDGTKNSTF